MREAIERKNWPKIADLANPGIRNQRGVEPFDYLRHWCNVARFFAYATPDYSWGEFEKEFGIIIRELAKGKALMQIVKEYLAVDPDEDVERWAKLHAQMSELVGADEEVREK